VLLVERYLRMLQENLDDSVTAEELIDALLRHYEEFIDFTREWLYEQLSLYVGRERDYYVNDPELLVITQDGEYVGLDSKWYLDFVSYLRDLLYDEFLKDMQALGREVERFIRLDRKGTWRGVFHRSSVIAPVVAGGTPEGGVSCYSMMPHGKGEALHNLVSYFFKIGNRTTPEEYADMQVTVFDGFKIGEGSDYEDIALPVDTIAELDAEPIMEEVLELYEDYELMGDISRNEYLQGLDGVDFGVADTAPLTEVN